MSAISAQTATIKNTVLHLSAAGLLAAALVSPGVASAQMMPLPKSVPVPGDNPMSPPKIELGKQLFFDPRLSLDGTVSCNSCHNVMSGGDDARAVSVGVGGQKGGRSAPTVWNSAFMTAMFWDGRMATLEDQAKGPMTNPVEMAMPSHDLVVERLKAIPGYVSQFEKVFGKNSLNIDNAARAIAAYERTLITPGAPVDRFLSGEKKALSAAAQRGLTLVQEVGCTSCHSGVNYAGPALPAGTPFLQKHPTFTDNAWVSKYNLAKDLGRYDVTKNESDRNMWRVPTLRNIALTAPYFHNGSVATLDEAVRVMAKTQLNRDLKDDQVADIVAFLEGLTGEFPAQTLPRLPATPKTSVSELAPAMQKTGL